MIQRHKPSRNRARTGFTLIEVLIASAIVALLTAGLGASLHVAFKARRSAADGIATIRAARIALDSLARDLQSALPPTGVLAGAMTGGSDTSGTISFYATSSGSVGNGASDIQQVTFTVIGPNDVQTTSGTAAASPLKPGAMTGSDESVLVRRVKRSLLAPVDETLTDQVLCRHVRSLTMRYYDGTQWLDTWDSTGVDNTLPLAIELTLSLAPTDAGSAVPYNITRVVHLPCGAIASTTSTGTATATPTTP